MGRQSARACVDSVSPNFLTPIAFPKVVSDCYMSLWCCVCGFLHMEIFYVQERGGACVSSA